MSVHHDKNNSILGDSSKKVIFVQPPSFHYASQSLAVWSVFTGAL